MPVADVDRAAVFYAAVLGIKIHKQDFGGMSLGILEHEEGNGGCLVKNPSEIASNGGILVYFNVDGRIKDAVAKVEHEVSMTGPRMQMTFLPKPGVKAPAPKPKSPASPPSGEGTAGGPPPAAPPAGGGPAGEPAPVSPAPATPPAAAQ